MKLRVVVVLGVTLFATACGSSPKPAAEPAGPAAAPAAPAAPAPVEPAAAAPASAAPAPAAAKPAEVTTSVTAVSNEVVTPNVVSPDKVIAELRPRLEACYLDGLKKDPKLAGSVTLSATIEKDGKVSAVTSKLLAGLSPAVVKCLTEKVKAANFAPSGGMNYTTSIDIPVRFASN